MNHIKLVQTKIIAMLLSIGLATMAIAHKHHHELPPAQTELTDSIYQLSSKWEDQNGISFNIQDLKGKPYLALMAYTKCQTACPLLVSDVKNVLKALPKKYQKMDVLLLSLDSKSETKESLLEFYKKRNLDKQWRLARSTQSEVTNIAAVLGVSFKALPDGEFIHSNSIFFIDENGIISAQQNGLNKADPNFVAEIIKKLSPQTESFLPKIKNKLIKKK